MNSLKLLVLLALAATGCSRPEPPQVIILVVVDTLRQDHLSCYGSSTPTPNLDRLAESGQTFSNAVGSFHLTTMSMGAMFTGHTPSIETGKQMKILSWDGRTWCGLRRFADSSSEEACIPKSVITLPEVLQEAGYWTIGITSNSLLLRPAGFERGFDVWVELPRNNAWSRVNAAATEAMERRPRDQLFLYVHYMDVHDYGREHPPYRPKELREYHLYPPEVSLVDKAVGELLEGMEGEGLLDDAVILVTGDHGERLGETHFTKGLAAHKGNPAFEEVLRIPLIVSPARFENTSSLVRTQDIFKMITTLAGLQIDIPPELDSDEVFLSEKGWMTYRRGRWKSFVRRRNGAYHLIDLIDDPLEQRDVAKENPSVQAAHQKRMATLALSLAAQDAPPSGPTAEDLRRLRALGYIE